VKHQPGESILMYASVDLMRTHLRFGRISAAIGVRMKDIPTSGRAPIPLLSHSARRVLYGGTQAENKPTHLTGDRKLASDPCITGALEA
jgi:hypothetical protein